MFDISFSELFVCFLVALIVLGPERLPGAARALGRWTGKARTYMRNFSAELERETSVAELKRELEEARRILADQGQKVQGTAREMINEVGSAAQLARLRAQEGDKAPAAPVANASSTTTDPQGERPSPPSGSAG